MKRKNKDPGKALLKVLNGPDTMPDEFDDMMARADAAKELASLVSQSDDEKTRRTITKSLLSCLGDSRWRVRYAASFGVAVGGSQWGDLAAKAIEPLLACTADEHKDVRDNAIEALGEIVQALGESSEAERAIGALGAALDDTNTGVRQAAARGLAKAGELGAGLLASALASEQALKRIDVIDALPAMEGERAAELLIGVIDDADYNVRLHAVMNLTEIAAGLKDSPVADGIRRALAPIAEGSDDYLRPKAKAALLELG